MTVFVSAVDAGNFSAAARILGITPSAVSKQISRLEARLGARLLNRSTRRISLTAENPIKALYQVIGRGGNPPGNMSTVFAVISLILTVVSLVVVAVGIVDVLT